MFTKTMFAASALLSLAAAVPLQQQNKRDYIYETKTMTEVTTIDVTTTIWLEAGETAPAHYGHGHNKPKVTSHIRQTVTVPAASPAAPSSPPEQSAPVAPVPSSPPAPTTSAWAAPTSQAPAPPPAPKPTKSPGGGSGAPSGQTYTGDITYYTPGLGSCGMTNTESDSIVALAADMMAATDNGNPNTNPTCGKSITISYGGVTATATIVDTCPGCAHGSLDLTPTLFEQFAQLSVGRVSGVEWWYN